MLTSAAWEQGLLKILPGQSF